MSNAPSHQPALDPSDYEKELLALVRDTAPQLFAVVMEYAAGTADADAVVVAWGHTHGDGATEVVGVHGARWSLASPERVIRYFRRTEECAPRLVWLAPPTSEPLTV